MPRKYHGPLQKGKRSAYVPRRDKRGRFMKAGGARPMRSLPSSYRQQNVHRFVRETLPQTLPLSILPGGTSFPAMGYLEFANLQFNQLVSATAEFGALFARYKVDKIETILTPMFQETIASNNNVGYPTSPGLRITRINTKWFNAPTNLGTTSDAVLGELAQIQSKSVSNYASKRSLKLVTTNPGVTVHSVLDSTSTEIATRGKAPWLSIGNQADVPFKHNSIIFAERTDGLAVDANWKYRVVHKVYFRCVQVG